MEVSALYDLAKEYAGILKNETPAIASGAELCLIVTDTQDIISGVTGKGVHKGQIVSYPAECVAVTAMFAQGQFKAKQMIIISMDDESISVPCLECLEMLLLLDRENDCCEAVISEERCVALKDLEVPEEDDDDDIEEEMDEDSEEMTEEEPEEESVPEEAPAVESEEESAPEEAPAVEPEEGTVPEEVATAEPEEEAVPEEAPAVEPEEESAPEEATAAEPEEEAAAPEEPKPQAKPAFNFFSGFNDTPSEDADETSVFEGGFDESYSAPQHEPVKTIKKEDETLGAPAEFSSGFAVDESNPFYEAPDAGADIGAAVALNESFGTKSEEANAASDKKDKKNAKKVSKDELLKQAKKKKKVAKANFNFFKKKM